MESIGIHVQTFCDEKTAGSKAATLFASLTFFNFLLLVLRNIPRYVCPAESTVRNTKGALYPNQFIAQTVHRFSHVLNKC